MSTLIESELQIHNMERFKSKLESLNKKAIKLGFQPITFEIGGFVSYDVENEWGEKIVYEYYPVTIFHEGKIELPGGWHLLAVLDHKEGLNRIVPGQQLPVFYRDRCVCDHCKTVRDRNETFVLINKLDQTIQVGRTCLGEYLGINPASVLGQIDWFKSAQDEDWGVGDREPVGYRLDNFLAHVALMLRTCGWVSRGTAYEQRDQMATADRAWFNITEKNSIKRINPSPSDCATGNLAAEWLQNLHERADLNEFMYNLAQIGKNGYVTHKSAGFAAAAINAMNKEIEDKLNNQNKRHLGVVGKRYLTDVKLIKSSGRDLGYGISYRHRFVDHEGNVIIWSTTTELEVGRDYEIAGRVKAHDVWNGEPQTIMTHCKVE